MTKVLIKFFLLISCFCNCLFLFGCEDEKIYIDETFQIHTEEQANYLEGDYKYISLYADGSEELSKPNAITISWDNITNASEFTFYLSETKDFDIVKKIVTDKREVSLINLKINTVYFWYLEYFDGELKKSDVKTFIIDSKTPRNLSIDGLTNVRDLGGYEVGKNQEIKQGMIYRSSRLNENETTDLLITSSGIKEMVEELKIKSELDIRRVDNNENGGICESPLGESVNYYSVPMKSGGNCILLNKTVIKDAFAILGNENNYPIVIHYSIGTDRTGMLCFLINALLGVSEEDLYRDYLFSNFGNIGGNRTPSIIDTYLLLINACEGNDLSEKTYNYLLSIGVSKVDLDNIKEIMIED